MDFPKDIDHFLKQESFKEWVLRTNERSVRYWEDYYEQHPMDRLVMEDAASILEGFHQHGTEWSSSSEDKLWARIDHEIGGDKPLVKRMKRKRPVAMMIAALLFGIGLISGLYHLVPMEGEVDTVMQAELIIRSNPKGQKTKIHMPDGSSVYLNSESELKYSSDFGISNRDIYLVGEAFFKVESNKELPFIVHSQNLSTRAVGTEFNVNAYPYESEKVQLVEGEVLVYTEDQSLTLNAGEETLFHPEKAMTIVQFELAAAMAWTEGEIVFRRANMREIQTVLERWYDVEIRVENADQQHIRYNGDFQKASLKEVLESLSYSLKFNYTIQNKTVNIIF